jgi:hypothetical protein
MVLHRPERVEAGLLVTESDTAGVLSSSGESGDAALAFCLFESLYSSSTLLDEFPQ